jgi:hypothetical protein
MKKITAVVFAFAMLSSPLLAQDANTDHDKKMQHDFMMMTDQMISAQMDMLKTHMSMLTSFQALLRQMMANQNGGMINN